MQLLRALPDIFRIRNNNQGILFMGNSSGNIFAVLFAAVGLVGVLGVVSMQMVTGPVSTMTKVTQRNMIETHLMMGARLVVMNASQAASGGDIDGDGFIEPVEYVRVGTGDCTAAPTGGGCLPASLGASLTDPYGTRYGYCVWDHGTISTGHTDATVAAPYRLRGTNDPTRPILTLISAGPDRTFQTGCYAYDGAGQEGVVKSAGSDDFVFAYTYAEASAASGGLWTLKPGEPDTAEIAKDLQVKDTSGNVTFALDRATGIGEFLGITTDLITPKTGGTVELDGILQMTGNAQIGGNAQITGTAQIGGSLRIGGDAGACDGTRTGTMRYTAGADPDWEYCDGTAWTAFKGAAGGEGGGLPEAEPGQFCSAAVVGTFGSNENQLLICDGFQWVEFMKVENTGRSSVQIAQDTGACNPDKIGRLRFTNTEPPFEYCDGGPGWKPLTVPPLPEPGQPPENWILAFVTDETYTGNLGGQAGADTKCQNAASAAGLPGTYAAWLAGADGVAGPPPATRFSFTGTNTPIRMPDGTLLANSWADLTDGTLQNFFNVNQFGDRVDAFSKVWTNVKADGTAESGCNYGALTLGQSCAGIVYAGNPNGTRIYTTPTTDFSVVQRWSSESVVTGATSTTNGVSNTDKLLTLHNAGTGIYDAAAYCRSLGSNWYLPSSTEINYMLAAGRHSPAILNMSFGTSTTNRFFVYWSSTEVSSTNANLVYVDQSANSTSTQSHTKTLDNYSNVGTCCSKIYTRCVTREPEKSQICGGTLSPWTDAIEIGNTTNRGWVSSTTSQWTTGGGSSTCAAQNRLYCFQQSGTLTSGVIGVMRSIKMHLNTFAPSSCLANVHGRMALTSSGNMCVCRPTGQWTYLHNTNACVW
jgi:hypothetical protein